ncbi:MAG TPA: hypothetical protein PKL84_10375, partial [Candidatus Hydrogenedentes bacterium]|nr:hypothetical protein [Candidatus Hydrogenedentota bacterium]
FSPEAYLYWTRIQCLAWTAADFVIVFFCIRIANLSRVALSRSPHRGSYLALAATIPFVPGIALAKTGMGIFLLELAVTVPHFLLIVYIIGANLRAAPKALAGFRH